MNFRLVCTGGILPGFDSHTVSLNLVRLLKISPEQAARILSGKPVTLKRNVTEDKLQQYIQRFAQTGLVAHAEVDSPAAEHLAPPQQASCSADSTNSSADEIECPDCHERLARGMTTCRRCGRNIASDFASAYPGLADTGTPQNPANTPDGAVAPIARSGYRRDITEEDAPPACIGLTVSGRFSRRSLLRASLCNAATMAILATLGILIGGANTLLPVLLGILLLNLTLNVRNACLRFHDLGSTGWLGALMLIPGFNSLIFLFLMILPGQAHANAYGPKTISASWGSVLFALIYFGVSIGVFMEVGVNQWHLQQQRAAASANHALPKWEGKEPYEVVMYSQTSCSACAERREQLQAEGIAFTELMIDRDAGALHELNAKLQSAAFHDTLITPSFIINGRLLTNDPPLTLIHRAMRLPIGKT